MIGPKAWSNEEPHQEIDEEDGHQENEDEEEEDGQRRVGQCGGDVVEVGLIERGHVVKLQHHHSGPHDGHQGSGVGVAVLSLKKKPIKDYNK